MGLVIWSWTWWRCSCLVTSFCYQLIYLTLFKTLKICITSHDFWRTVLALSSWMLLSIMITMDTWWFSLPAIDSHQVELGRQIQPLPARNYYNKRNILANKCRRKNITVSLNCSCIFKSKYTYKQGCVVFRLNTVKLRQKWVPLCRQYSQMHFLDWKCLYFHN